MLSNQNSRLWKEEFTVILLYEKFCYVQGYTHTERAILFEIKLVYNTKYVCHTLYTWHVHLYGSWVT